MNKSVIIRKLAKKEGVSISVARKIIHQFLKLIAYGLKKEEKVSLKGFGTFYLAQVENQNKTSSDKEQKPKKKVRFKAGTELSSVVN